MPEPGADAMRLAGQLQSIAAAVPEAEIPELLGQLEVARVLLQGRYLRQPTPSPVEDRLLTVAEAAERLSVSKDYLYRHAHRLPFVVRQGRLVRFSSVGLERFIRAGLKKPWLAPTSPIAATGRKQETG